MTAYLDDGRHTSNSSVLPLGRHPLYSTISPDVARSRLVQTLLPSESCTSINSHGYDLQIGASPSQFGCVHNSFDFNGVSVNAIAYQTPVSFINLYNPGNDINLVLVLEGYCKVELASAQFLVKKNELFVINRGQTITAHTSPNFQEIVLRISGTSIDAAVTELIDRPVAIPLCFESCPAHFEGASYPLVRFVNFICTEIDQCDHLFRSRSLSRNYERTLVSLILTLIPHNYSDWISHEVLPPTPYYVSRAEKYIRNNFHLPITLIEVAAEAGVQPRTLQRGFRLFRRLTPIMFLKECRLQHARSQLQDPQYAHIPIADVARAAGFDHPSKFSSAYKDRFKELPSFTRRRGMQVKC